MQGIEACAFDVAEDEEFTACAATKSNGSYEIDRLDEGPYGSNSKSGSSGLNLKTQYYKGATSPGAATIVGAEKAAPPAGSMR